MKFLRDVAADAAAIGLRRPELQAHAGENAGVRIEHGAVPFSETRLIDVKGVGVLHDELARAHDAKARPDLVAELRLDLVEIHRKLLVAAQLAARDVGDDFLVRRPIDELAFVAVLEPEKLGTVLGPAVGFLPELCGLHGGHDQFQGAGAVHLFAHDALGLLQRAQPHR